MSCIEFTDLPLSIRDLLKENECVSDFQMRVHVLPCPHEGYAVHVADENGEGCFILVFAVVDGILWEMKTITNRLFFERLSDLIHSNIGEK